MRVRLNAQMQVISQTAIAVVQFLRAAQRDRIGRSEAYDMLIATPPI